MFCTSHSLVTPQSVCSVLSHGLFTLQPVCSVLSLICSIPTSMFCASHGKVTPQPLCSVLSHGLVIPQPVYSVRVMVWLHFNQYVLCRVMAWLHSNQYVLCESRQGYIPLTELNRYSVVFQRSRNQSTRNNPSNISWSASCTLRHVGEPVSKRRNTARGFA